MKTLPPWLAHCGLLALVAVLGFAPQAMADSAEEDWAALVALDAGPQTPPRNAEEARAAAVAHLDKQEAALRGFIGKYPADAHDFEARLRLSRLLQIRGDVQGNPKAVTEGRAILDQLDAKATPEQRVEVDFARLTLFMRTMRAPTPETRAKLLEQARQFQKLHAGDRRIAATLAEVATLYSLEPKTMRGLLEDAQRLTKDERLQGRISDDLRRLDLLGQPLALSFTGIDGKPFDIASHRGSVMWVVFFARWSQPSLEALENLKRTLASFPQGAVRVVALSLDPKSEPLIAFLKEKTPGWTVGCDGEGWQSPLIRSLGINSLPTAWLVDKQGRLRSLNLLDSTQGQTRQMLAER